VTTDDQGYAAINLLDWFSAEQSLMSPAAPVCWLKENAANFRRSLFSTRKQAPSVVIEMGMKDLLCHCRIVSPSMIDKTNCTMIKVTSRGDRNKH